MNAINLNTPLKSSLMFGFGNAKLSQAIGTFSLPAGYSCPFASACLSKAHRKTGHITDGPKTEFRCFAASQECTYTRVRQSRWNNFENLRKAKTVTGMAKLIQSSLPVGIGLIRVHVSGDFFSEDYFVSWLNVAMNNPNIVFYGYTKAIKYLVEYKKHIPSNFRFTASRGGTHDFLIDKHNLKSAVVVYSVKEAEEKRLEIDHDDYHAAFGENSFALLLHGVQPSGTKAGEALKSLKKQGLGTYNHAKRDNNLTRKPITIRILKVNGKIKKYESTKS